MLVVRRGSGGCDVVRAEGGVEGALLGGWREMSACVEVNRLGKTRLGLRKVVVRCTFNLGEETAEDAAWAGA